MRATLDDSGKIRPMPFEGLRLIPKASDEWSTEEIRVDGSSVSCANSAESVKKLRDPSAPAADLHYSGAKSAPPGRRRIMIP